MTASLNVLRRMREAGTPPQQDDFQRIALGWKWIGIGGTLSSIHDNGEGKPRGVAVYAGFGAKYSALRYYAPIVGNNVDTGFDMFFPPFVAGIGVTTALVCADQQFSSAIGVQFDNTLADGSVTVRIGQLASNRAPLIVGAEAVLAVAEQESMRVQYDDVTKTVVCSRGNDTVTWVDDQAVVPHGMGYTYVGFSWEGDVLTTGPQITGWSIQ